MGRVLSFLVTAAVVVVVAWFVAGLPGRVDAEVAGYSFEAAAPVAVLVIVVGFLILYLLFRLLAFLVGLPRRIRRTRFEGRRRQGDLAVTRTLVALGAGEAGGARREATRARRLLGDTPQTLLLAAEAGRLAGEESEAEKAFRALADRPDAKFLGLRGLLRQAIGRQDWTEAVELARQAEQARPGAAWLRAERRSLAIRTGAWSEALALADAKEPKAELAAAAADAEPNPEQAVRYAKRAWDEKPDFVPAALAYARRLQELGRPGRALEVLRRTWAHSPHPDLATVALRRLSVPVDRLREAERLAQENPQHPESLLLLGRTSLDAGQLEEAKRFADRLQATGFNQRRFWTLRAAIADAEKSPEAALAAHAEALRGAATAEPDPVWHCTACGTPLLAWKAACPSCGTPGQVVWSSGFVTSSLAPARQDAAIVGVTS